MLKAKRSMGIVSAAALVWACGVAQGQGVKTLLTVEKADLAAFVSSPKDAGLREALSMIPARLRELPGEAPDVRTEDIELALSLVQLLARPGRLAVVYDAGYPAGGFLGYGIIASARVNDEKDLAALEARIDEALAQANLPDPPRASERFPSMREVSVPPLGTIAFGKRKADDGWRYEIVAGSVDSLDPVMKQFPPMEGKGWSRTLVGTFDLSALTPAVNFAQQMAGNSPELADGVREMTDAGVLGPDAIRGTIEAGVADGAAVTRLTVSNARTHAKRWLLPSEPLTRDELNAVPADAVLASVSRTDLSALDQLLAQVEQEEPGLEEALAQFKEETGVDVREDILGSLGGTGAVYTSDTTGGGGLASLVMLTTFKDRARFLAAHDKLIERAARLIEDENPRASRYIRFKSWEQDGVRVHTLSARGLPVPLEITYAATDKWLVAGLLPQAVFEAVRQATGRGGPGLATSPMIRNAWRDDRPVTGLTVFNPQDLIRRGYPITSMAGSALAGAVRSPGGERDIELIVPTFRDLTRGVTPYTQVGFWQGDAYVVESVGDPSVLVTIATGVGAVMELSPLIATAMIGEETDALGMSGPRPAWASPAPLASTLLRSIEPRWMVLSPLKVAAAALEAPASVRERVMGVIPALPGAEDR